MRNLKIERKAENILKQHDLLTIPVPVVQVAHRLGLRVDLEEFGDDISGVLVVEGKGGVIGLNAAHAKVRQRFTAAHECGHFVLHRDEEQLFIDKRYIVAFRDTRSSSGEDRLEREANAFAAALLMPESLVRQALKSEQFDLADDRALEALADLFQVSRQAMSFRLANLSLLGHLGLE